MKQPVGGPGSNQYTTKPRRGRTQSGVSPETLHRLALQLHQHPQGDQGAVASVMSVDSLGSLSVEQKAALLAQNEHTPVAEQILAKDPDMRVRTLVAHHPGVSRETLVGLLDDEEIAVAQQAADRLVARDDASSEDVDAAARVPSRDLVFCSKVVGHPKASAETLEYMWDTVDSRLVRRAVLRHPNCPAALKARALL